MISGFYHHSLYLLAVFLLSLVILYRYGLNTYTSDYKIKKGSFNFFIIIVFLFALFIGFRDPYSMAYGDTYAYTRMYEAYKGEPFSWDWSSDNFIFDNLFLWMSSLRVPIELCYVIIAIIYFISIWFSCRIIFPNDSSAAYLVYLASLSTYSYGVNGIKAGAAAALFLMAIGMIMMRKKVWTVVFLILSLGFHHSMFLPIGALFICYFLKNPRLYLFIWLVSFFIALLHITFFQDLFLSIGSDIDDRVINYLGDNADGYFNLDLFGGFRIDFIFYSIIPILIGSKAIFKNKIKSQNYYLLFNTYTLINAIWMLCMYASFTNRIAYLSWLMYPFVLIYPFLNEKVGKNQHKVFKWVAYGNLAFTLFMNYIY